MTKDYKNEITNILETLGQQLDISESQYNAAVKSYEAVGDWLSKEGSKLYPYNPRIIPQGSFMLGTIVRPINDEDDIDIDLVCKLEGKPSHWAQIHLKNAVGDRLKEHSKYREMLEDEKGGRRCWTLEYSEDANYHLDVLPSISDKNFTKLFNESFNRFQDINADKLAIRITDNEESNYATETDVYWWMKSNPFGYAKWFYQRAIHSSSKMITLSASVDPVKPYEKEKMPLQRAVQLLKRHRDIMFSSDDLDSENRPISIIITTLAARAYDKSENLMDAYTNIVSTMRNFIETRLNKETGQYERWVSNPINDEENFADKWADTPQKEEYFYLWLDKLEADLYSIRTSDSKGLHMLNQSLSSQYGDKAVNLAFTVYGENNRKLRESGQRKMARETGFLGTVGTTIPNHNFEGKV
jgi:hypothetical protein